MIRFAALTSSPWRNGMGRRADIATGPGWTLGFAWLEADAPFSDYTGQDRTITLVEGAGFELRFAGHPPRAVDRPFAPAAFDGGWACHCRLRAGPCLVLNAISDRAMGTHRVAIAAALPAAGFAVLLRGAATLADGSIAGPLDALPMPHPARLAPGSLLAAVTFAPNPRGAKP